MKVEKRWSKIEQILNTSGSASIQELAAQLNVSETTIRRDLVKMEEQNMIKRLWGGASVLDSSESDETRNFQDDYILKFCRNIDTKKALARYAASLIHDGDCVFIDAGSTTSYVAEFIEASDITLVTNAMNIFQTLAKKKIRTYIPNGYINFGSAAIMSSETGQQLANMNFDLAFLGTSGIDLRAGFTTQNEHDAAIKQSVLSRCAKSFILSESSKFDIKRFYTFANPNDVTLITNEEPPFSMDKYIVIH